MRKVHLLSEILLKKHERALVPFFEQNLFGKMSRASNNHNNVKIENLGVKLDKCLNSSNDTSHKMVKLMSLEMYPQAKPP